MSFAPSRRPLRGLELTGHRRNARWFLVLVVLVGAALALVGFGLGHVRIPVWSPGTNTGWGEWRSYAIESWFIPLLAAFAVAGLALMVRRGRPFTGVALGAATVLAETLSIIAEPEDVVFAVDGFAEIGYLGLVIMGFAGVALIITEPILAIYERRHVELREPGLPVARVVR